MKPKPTATRLCRSSTLFLVSALTVVAVGAAFAEAPRPGMSDAEQAYQAAPGALDPALATDLHDGEGPPMSKDEFAKAKAKEIFFQRCAAATACCARAPPASP